MTEQMTVSIPETIYQRIRELVNTRNQTVDDVLVEVLDSRYYLKFETSIGKP